MICLQSNTDYRYNEYTRKKEKIMRLKNKILKFLSVATLSFAVGTASLSSGTVTTAETVQANKTEALNCHPPICLHNRMFLIFTSLLFDKRSLVPFDRVPLMGYLLP